jgi:hypothetical protein
MADVRGRKFRKTPVVIEAMRYEGDPVTRDLVLAFAKGKATYYINYNRVSIDTGAGYADLLPGDWIIKGVKGEFYPCKPDIFAMTYEEVPDDKSLIVSSQYGPCLFSRAWSTERACVGLILGRWSPRQWVFVAEAAVALGGYWGLKLGVGPLILLDIDAQF